MTSFFYKRHNSQISFFNIQLVIQYLLYFSNLIFKWNSIWFLLPVAYGCIFGYMKPMQGFVRKYYFQLDFLRVFPIFLEILYPELYRYTIDHLPYNV